MVQLYVKRLPRYEMVPNDSPENFARIMSYGWSESEITPETVMVFNVDLQFPESLSTAADIATMYEPDIAVGAYTNVEKK